VLSWYFNYTPEYTYTTTFVFFGSTGLYVLSAMALTSWDIAQKKIPTKWWNVIHTGLLVGYVGYIAFFMQYVLDLATWHKVTLSLFLLFWVCMTPWGLPKKLLRRVSGWKQLHMLVYIAYASLVIHIWTGTLEFVEAEWLRMGFWALTILVVGSHVVGWVMMLARRFAKSNTANDSITVEGKTYLRVGGTADFLEGKGKRIDIGNLHVAVFKYNNGFFGMSAECPHQKGPIADGKIVNGFVECPWHRYQFGVTDGFGPAEFKDCIPYYKAVEQNGAVYLCSESTGKCDVH
jgi:nitrite reductase/ring-hydroxylating ferredoxin subunit/DMSO/TMAO reductase YedYZ heme-binding membrane subunit